MSGSQPSKRRRIAGESKPGLETPQAKAAAAPRLPKLRRPGANREPAAATTAVGPPPPLPPVATPTAVPASVPRITGLRISGGSWAWIAVTVLAVAFGVFGAVIGIQKWTGDDPVATRKEAADAAASAAQTIFSYQYNKLPEHLKTSQELMTPSFAKKFRSISPALNALAPQRKIQVKAVVRDAATVECGDDCNPDKANVLIFIDQARVADESTKPTVFGNRILVSMVKSGDDWLVSNIKAL